MPNEKLSKEFFLVTNKLCKKHSFNQYEISNFAKKDFQCFHNLNYWKCGNFISIGPGAHGRLMLDDKWYATHKFSAPKMWLNRNLKKKSSLYLNKEISNIKRAQEILLTSLRLTKGIDIKKAFNKLSINYNNDILNENELRKFKELNLIDETDSLLKVTNKGFPILNYITNNLIL